MKYLLILIPALLIPSLTLGQAISRTDTLPSGELMLVQEITVNQSLNLVWKAFTEPEEWKQWVTPVVEIDFRVNGSIKSHYDPSAAIGDPGTIVIHVLSYIPEKEIVMQSEISESFPEFVQGEEKNLYSIFHFDEIENGTSRVTIYGIGYKNEKRWHELLKFFIQGNEMTLNNLKKYIEQ